MRSTTREWERDGSLQPLNAIHVQPQQLSATVGADFSLANSYASRWGMTAAWPSVNLQEHLSLQPRWIVKLKLLYDDVLRSSRNTIARPTELSTALDLTRLRSITLLVLALALSPSRSRPCLSDLHHESAIAILQLDAAPGAAFTSPIVHILPPVLRRLLCRTGRGTARHQRLGRGPARGGDCRDQKIRGKLAYLAA